MRSPGCCAAFLASSPGHPFKVFTLTRADLQYLRLSGIRCTKFCLKAGLQTCLYIAASGTGLALMCRCSNIGLLGVFHVL